MDRALPSHIKAEQAVLGSIFLDGRKVLDVMDKLKVEDFFDLRHQVIYQAMMDLHNDDMKIDYTSVTSKLEQGNNMGKSGGLEYVFSLYEHVASTTHIETHISLVLDASLKREVIDVTSKLTQLGFSKDLTANDYVNEAEEKIFAVSQKRKTTEFSKLGQVVTEVREKLDTISQNKGGISGLKTGFANLDKVTNGLQPEELIILAARPSMGKSAFALNLALNAAKRNKEGKASVAVFSLEMSNDQLASRMISYEADIPGGKLKSGHLDATDWANLTAVQQSMDNLNIFFDDSGAVEVSDIRAKCRKLAQENKLDFVVIDYLQLIQSAKGNTNRQEEVAKISRSLKQMARELKVPVMALSQLSRAVETRDDKRPVLADLRESGSIEQDADIVLFLYRDDYYTRDEASKTKDAELIIAKNRQGQSGVALYFKFDPPYSRFTATERRDEE